MNTTRLSLLVRLNDREDSEAWNEFDRIYRPMLYRFAHASGVTGPASDDLIQDCMAQVVQHVSKFSPQGPGAPFRGWLKRLVVNRLLNLRRVRQEFPARSTILSGLPAREPNPEEVFDQICREECLKFCLGQVRDEVEPRTFEAFQLHVLEEEPAEVVCRKLQMTPNQLYRIKWRVTRKVAQHMEALHF